MSKSVVNSGESHDKQPNIRQSAEKRIEEQPVKIDRDDQKSLGADYWDRIAEDAAKGYKDSGEDSILNEDQMKGDNKSAGQV